jgi:hypothetical protein
VLGLVQHRDCWPDERERARAEARALAGVGQFHRCFELARRFDADPAIRSILAYCAARRAARG